MSIVIRAINKLRRIRDQIFNDIILKKEKALFGEDLQINGIIKIENQGKIQIGSHFRANSGVDKNPIGGDTIARLVVLTKAELTIGDNVGLSNSTIFCTNKVTIGNNVMIGGSCKIWDTDFHSLDPLLRTGGNDTDICSKEINIKDFAFIGGSSIILKGVTIGKNSIVAAGSVVTKSIPDNEIWGGNPAKFIRTL